MSNENKRTVLITGGNRGIGLAIGRRFGQEGYRVVILDLPAEPGAAAAALTTDTGGAYYCCDITRKARVDEVIADVLGTFGFVDVLVNNAGVLKWTSFIDTTEEEFDLQFNVNVKGIYFVSQPIVRSMIARGRGNIINMGSMGGKDGAAIQTVYCASKAAVIQLTKVMAKELGPHNIRVNSLCPGIIQTDIGNDAPMSADSWLVKTPLGRLGDPEDVAGVAYFLASDDAKYMTGQAINVTGGMMTF
ncbi:SDR family NAD(P)-dependent oxidoreductase [Paenibacillus macerans]|uniref:SDR family NAD(P)-dependent oxidoreductase n=1 Tax=Paenibacillus macerans TaxID=44252 RepID=UPI002E1AE638|nr:SDR family NAD(P)-dependent oxidoreductase [Paenibacillus macerans]